MKLLQEAGLTPPYALLWLRYSAFTVLYPIGVGSELTMAWLALPTIRQGSTVQRSASVCACVCGCVCACVGTP